MIVTLWLGSLTLIATSTLSPFAFDFHALNIREATISAISTPTNPIDILANLILFFPLGFSSYALTLRRPHHNASLCLTSVGLMSVLISLLVEILQHFLPARYPTLSDIICNGLSGFLGGLFAWQLSSPANKISAINLNKKACIIGFAGYFTSVYLGLFIFASQTQISNWQTSYPLTIGNIASGDSPWLGQASNIFMFDSALASESIEQLLDFKLDANSYESLAFYCLLEEDIQTANHHLPSEINLCAPSSSVQDRDNNPWYLINNNKVDFISRIEANSAFTLALKINSRINPRFGTVLAIADDIDRANLILGIQGEQLTCRIRFPLSGLSSITPELILNDYTQNSIDQTFVIVYDGVSFQIYKDKINSKRGTSLLSSLYFFQPLSKIYSEWRLELFKFDLYKWLFIFFTFEPAVFLLELLKKTGNIQSSRENTQYVISISILAFLISSVYTNGLNIWLFDCIEVLAIILFCWVGTKLYFVTLEKYQL